jgi:hypothetical protein
VVVGGSQSKFFTAINRFKQKLELKLLKTKNENFVEKQKL